MLFELRVENLLLIERAELRLGPGLTAITGETGAGKTILAHALDLLLGGRPRSGIVRPGAREAYVEGVFACPQGALDGDDLADLRERLPEENDELVLGRRVSAEGRTLLAERGRLGALDSLRTAAGAGAEALAPEAADGPSATAALAESERHADAVAGADPQLDALAARLRALRIEAEDLGGELRRYGDGLEAEPGRLEEVESRLDRYDRLKRKHG